MSRPDAGKGPSIQFSALLRHFVALVLVFIPLQAYSADITWGGEYRVEGVGLVNPELGRDQTTGGGHSTVGYVLHHLTLFPKLEAADGVTIFGRLDVMNGTPGQGIDPAGGRIHSVAGEVLGHGPGPGPGLSTPSYPNASDSNALANTETAGTIAVSELYLSWAQEFGQLLVGRMPMQFGLGLAFNAGNGLFDHYIDTKDAIAYKVVFGNLYVMPIIGKVNRGGVGDESDVNDYMLQVMYENPETELALGAFYQMRIGTLSANDYPLNNDLGGGDINPATATIPGTVPNGTHATSAAPATLVGGFQNTLLGVYTAQKLGNFKIAVEFNMLTGNTGLQDNSQNGVSVNAYGVAGELTWNPPDSRTSGAFKFGMASGDDPGTTNVYEGYQFNRNYQVGMLLFHHPLGQQDFLRTGLIRPNGVPVRDQLDDEAISNAIYFAPSLQFKVRDSFSWGGTFVYGMLNKDPIVIQSAPSTLGSAGTNVSLGEELDLNVNWKPMERLTWITTIGGLLPGAAWQAGSLGYDNSIAYGFETKAAITF